MGYEDSRVNEKLIWGNVFGNVSVLSISVMGHSVEFNPIGISILYYVLFAHDNVPILLYAKSLKKSTPFNLFKQINSSLLQNKNGISFILPTLLHPADIAISLHWP